MVIKNNNIILCLQIKYCLMKYGDIFSQVYRLQLSYSMS